jgi:DNA-binding MarR family transcriptional regulator
MPNSSSGWYAGQPMSVNGDHAAADFLAAFDTFVQAVRRARGAPARGGERELTLSQYALLGGLASRDGGARVRELAGQAGITASTATRILDALERREIVRRDRADEDRRAVTVTLTDRGRTMLAEQDDWVRARTLGFYEGLPADEREMVPDLLARLAALIDELAAGPGGC